jgi:crossover junction endodeoxyribonuclease RuvC
VLGIDPGSRVLGYGVIDVGAKVVYVECGVITADERAAPELRLAEIVEGLGEVIGELRPQVVAMEDVFTCKNARTALLLGQARGAALAACGARGLSVRGYPPATVKQSVTGQGRAEKEQVARMVAALLGLRTVPRADAADALAVALTHARHVATEKRGRRA